MNKLRAYWRAFRGYCPACNLDAPAIDTCQVCHNYRGEWPPPAHIAASWLFFYFDWAGVVNQGYRVTVSGPYLLNLIQRATAHEAPRLHYSTHRRLRAGGPVTEMRAK